MWVSGLCFCGDGLWVKNHWPVMFRDIYILYILIIRAALFHPLRALMLTTRYLIKNLLSSTVFIALTLTMVIWLTLSLKILELVANSDAPASLFVKLVALSLPRFLEIILPLSLVAAV